jgi:hypothetical protein
MALKFVLVEIVLVETVLVGDPLYLGKINTKENISMFSFA